MFFFVIVSHVDVKQITRTLYQKKVRVRVRVRVRIRVRVRVFVSDTTLNCAPRTLRVSSECV
jgi:hypothetical protein